MYRVAGQAIEVIKSRFLAGESKKDLIGTWAEYEEECITYDPEADFRPWIFAELPFPAGTVSYIGARAKVGKTVDKV